MKNKIFPLVAGLVLSMTLAGAAEAKKKIKLVKEKDKLSYAIGLSLGKSFKMQSLDLSLEMLLKGIETIMYEEKPLMTDKEAHETMERYKNKMRAQLDQKKKKIGEKNKTEGEQFLVLNKKKPGVIILPSGLQYKIIKRGYGKKPNLSSSVVANYRGTLLDGTEFDSSYKRGKPATFKVSGLIKGWVEALPLMKTGSKWKLFVPHDLAYGDQQAGHLIGPNSTLIFEIELLEIKSGQ